MLNRLTISRFVQGKPADMPAHEAGVDHVPLREPDAHGFARNPEGIAGFAEAALQNRRQLDLCAHHQLARLHDKAAGFRGILREHHCRSVEQRVNALERARALFLLLKLFFHHFFPVTPGITKL